MWTTTSQKRVLLLHFVLVFLLEEFMNLDRLIKLVGVNGVEEIKRLNILIVGLGGVGGYAFETLFVL